MITIAEIAAKIEGNVDGDGSFPIDGIAGLDDAVKGDLSFMVGSKYALALKTTKASAVIVSNDWRGESPCTLIRVSNPDQAFSYAVGLFSKPLPVPAPGIHSSAVIAENVLIEDDVYIGPYCVIEPGVSIGRGAVLFAGCYIGRETTLGKECRFYPCVSIREFVTIGNHVIIHNGAVIGSDGFGYLQNKDGSWEKIPQVGSVIVGDNVEIGANVTIDRARFGNTIIGNGVKIDNLVQVAHNASIGEHTAMAAQVAIAGSVSVGAYVQLGGQAGVTGHAKIGDRSIVGGGAGVTKDVPSETFVSGYPAKLHREAARENANIRRLPHLKEKVSLLESRIAKLELAVSKMHGAKNEKT